MRAGKTSRSRPFFNKLVHFFVESHIVREYGDPHSFPSEIYHTNEKLQSTDYRKEAIRDLHETSGQSQAKLCKF